jgi:Spy/CpxP family protein refolding chaperone
MKTRIGVILIVGFLFITASLAAQPPDSRRGKIHGMKMLDLTEDQKNKIAEKKLQIEKEILPIRGQMDKLHTDLKLEMTADNFDEGKVKKIVSNLTDLEEEIRVKRLLNRRAIRDLLTAEQKQKFDLITLSRGGRGKRPMHNCQDPQHKRFGKPHWEN